MNLHQKEFVKLIERLSYGHQIWRVFSDFCEMAALSFSNAILKNAEREERYLRIIGRYSKEEAQQFPKLLGLTAMGLEDWDCDFLGEVFMGLELGNHWKGQFFTPFHLCRMMADMQAGDVAEIIARRGFVTGNDPCCGGGAMLIGLARALRDRGINPQQHLHVTATDVDATAAHMCYVQLCWLHIPAVVIVGNSLSLEVTEAFYTPAHHLGFWDYKLKRGHLLGYEPKDPAYAESEPVAALPEQVVESLPPAQKGQLTLF